MLLCVAVAPKVLGVKPIQFCPPFSLFTFMYTSMDRTPLRSAPMPPDSQQARVTWAVGLLDCPQESLQEPKQRHRGNTSPRPMYYFHSTQVELLQFALNTSGCLIRYVIICGLIFLLPPDDTTGSEPDQSFTQQPFVQMFKSGISKTIPLVEELQGYRKWIALEIDQLALLAQGRTGSILSHDGKRLRLKGVPLFAPEQRVNGPNFRNSTHETNHTIYLICTVRVYVCCWLAEGSRAAGKIRGYDIPEALHSDPGLNRDRHEANGRKCPLPRTKRYPARRQRVHEGHSQG